MARLLNPRGAYLWTPSSVVHAHGLCYPRRGSYPGRGLDSFEEEVVAYPRGLRRLFGELAAGVARRFRRLNNFIFSMGNAYETALLLLEFNNTNLANVGDATGLRGSTTAGSHYVALHTADPGEAGDQTSSEATFTGYVRQPVARSAGGWTVAGNQVSNTALIAYAQNAGADQTCTHFSVGVSVAGASVNVRYGPLVASGASWLSFTATAADVVTIPGHSLVVDNRVVFAAAYDGALPTGVTQGTVYWVKTVAGNDITISTTQGGATVDITAAGSGVAVRALPLTVRGGIDAVQFSIGTLVSKID